ncbi:hypothetical protein PQR01_00450 [Paraburkholderia rhynchosiae]|uniref:Uncharacterized protein n=1 Tax=Paraburkholderia rhynchosiae TaxID=487049 RepID=A0ACC7N4G2_9BURK
MGLLDGLMNEPASLGLLSAGTNIMAASGPSRMPVGLGTVLSQGLQGAVGGYQGAINNQYDRVSKALQLQNLQYQASQNGLLNDIIRRGLSGQQESQAAPGQPAAPQSVATGIPVLDAGGVPAGTSDSGQGATSMPVPATGDMPQGSPVAAAPQPQSGAPAPQASGGMFGGIPPQQAALAIALGQRAPALAGAILDQYKPTDFQKLLTANGIDQKSTLGRQLLQQQIAKQNNMPLQAFRGGGYAYNPATQTMEQLPQVPEGYTAAQGPNGWQIVPVAGATGAIAASAAAKEGGVGSVLPYSGVDAQGNPLPITNRTAAATGGTFGNQPPPIPTLPGLGGAQAQGGAAVPLPGGPIPGGARGGAIYAAPPMGSVANANDAQAAPAQTMKDSYSKLQGASSTANAALEALQKMQQLASGKTVLSTGPLGTLSTPINPSAAEYEKQRANVITLLANQNGTNGTDAGRALTGESVPDYGKPASAIKDGIGTLVNQVKVGQLKANFLTPAYNAGDSKAYTHLENQFDQNVSPSMMPLLTMPAGPARAAALKQAAQNPQMRSRLEWAVQNGVLK